LKRYYIFLLCGLFVFSGLATATNRPDSSDSAPSLFPASNYSRNNQSGILNNYYAAQVATRQESNSKKSWFKAMRYAGWARFYPYYRNMDTYYDIPPGEGLTLPVTINANDGYQQPLMLIRLEGNPSAKTWFQTELQFDHLMGRTTQRTNQMGRYGNLYVIFQLQGGVDTRFGKFKMIAGGGANWYRLSPSTLWGYQYRDDFFERYPWEPEGHDFARYNSFYSAGDIPRDQRFGMQATQGFILEGTDLPHGFDAALLYGKNSTSGGFQSYLSKNPQNMFATRVGKKIGDHKVGFNYFDQFGYTTNKVNYVPAKIEGVDTFYVEDNFMSQTVMSVDGRFEFKNFSLYSEIGMGSYLSNTYHDSLRKNARPGVANVSRYKRKWDETLFLEITTKKRLTYIPIKLALYRVGPLVVNNSSSMANTSVEQAKPNIDVPDEYYTNYFDGMITEVGQLANNRQGVNLFVSKDFLYNKLKTKLALGASQEVVNLAGDVRNGARAYTVAGSSADSLTKVPFTNSITFEHKLNGFTRSRYAFFKRFTGPYNRLHSIFRRSFENVAITDSVIDYKKSFSTIDLELKYKFRFLGKEVIVSSFTDISSVQENWSPIPVWTDKAFLRYFYEELMVFYALHSQVTLVGFGGFEKVLGNQRTELADASGNLITDNKGRPVADPNGNPINQTGFGYGYGLDYNFHSRASVNLRHRWFRHQDKHFILDKFKGNEMTVELKVFF
jgi:opacity protein-like surface antigen